MKKHPVLILGGNDRVATALVHALAFREFITFVGAGAPYAHALYLVGDARRISLPPLGDGHFVANLIDECMQRGIRVVIPSGDDELIVLNDARDRLDERGIELLAPSAAVVTACNDRRRLFESCRDIVAIPRISTIDDSFQTRDWTFPVQVRKRCRDKGDEVGVASTPAELDRIGWGEDLMAQTYLGGERYYVEVLCDESGAPVFCQPVVELRSRESHSTAYRTIHDPELQNLALRVVAHLGLNHAASVRFQRDRDDNLFLTDVTPRFSRALPLVVAAGFNPVVAALRGLLGIERPRRPEHMADMAMIPGSDPLFLPCEEVERLEDLFLRARIERRS